MHGCQLHCSDLNQESDEVAAEREAVHLAFNRYLSRLSL